MTTTRRYWLLKSEPEAFSFDDLWESPGRTTPWDGVRNYQARNRLRDEMQPGDGVLFYHSGTKEPGVAGVAEVAGPARPDPTQFDPRSAHPDPKSSPGDPRWWLVDVRATARIARPVALAELREDPLLAGMELLRRGNRLSVQALSEAEWHRILERAGNPPEAAPPARRRHA